MKTAHELLVEGRTYIDPESRWAKGMYAFDRKPEPGTNWIDNPVHSVEPKSDAATCFCSLGALMRAADMSLAEWSVPEYRLPSTAYEAAEILSSYTPEGVWIAVWQDARETTHAEVLAVWDAAIEATRP